MNKHQNIQNISIELLKRGKYQPRRHFDAEQLQELADSIKTLGLLQPIVVRPLSQGNFEIIAGERRWRAAQLAGLTSINCIVYQFTDEQTLQAAIIENINRADLNPIEEAEAYQRLIDEFHYLHEEIAAAVGKSRASITNVLRLLKLDKSIQELLITKKLSEGHGKILAGLAKSQQILLAELCLKKKWSVRKTEIEAKKMINAMPENNPYSDPNLKKLELSLSEYVGNKVELNCEARGGGFLKIRFNNIDELEGQFEKLGFKYQED